MADDQISDEAPLLCNESIQRHDDINKKFNSKNAKKIALCFVFWFIVVHSCIHLFYGKYTISDLSIQHLSLIILFLSIFIKISFIFVARDSCKWLLSDGRYKGDMGWQPYGCMMHEYSEL